jgi:hypothetical protein
MEKIEQGSARRTGEGRYDGRTGSRVLAGWEKAGSRCDQVGENRRDHASTLVLIGDVGRAGHFQSSQGHQTSLAAAPTPERLDAAPASAIVRLSRPTRKRAACTNTRSSRRWIHTGASRSAWLTASLGLPWNSLKQVGLHPKRWRAWPNWLHSRLKRTRVRISRRFVMALNYRSVRRWPRSEQLLRMHTASRDERVSFVPCPSRNRSELTLELRQVGREHVATHAASCEASAGVGSTTQVSVGTLPAVAVSIECARSRDGLSVPPQSREMVAGVVPTRSANRTCFSPVSSR